MQIAEGIQAAQERVREMDVKLTPGAYSDGGQISEIEFDMAVTVTQETDTGEAAEGRISVLSAFIGAGVAAKTGSNKKEEHLTVSRIRFTVQAVLPAANKGEKRPRPSRRNPIINPGVRV